jgi:hypothetical protein
MLEDGKKTDDDVKTDDGVEEMVDGVPASVANAIDKVNDELDAAVDDDDQYEDAATADKDADDKTGVASDTDLDEEDDDTDGTKTDDDDDEVKVEGIDVLGWDAETVQKLNEINPDLMKDVQALLDAGEVKNSSEEDDELAPKKTDKVETDGLLTDDQLAALEKKDPEMAAIVKGLNTTVGKLTESLNTVAEADEVRAQKAEQKEAYSNFRDTNNRLDKLAEEHPILGQYDKLPLNGDGVPDERNKSVKVRARVYGQARALQATGEFGSFSESLDTAISLFEGNNSEQKATRKIAGELRKRSTQITTRPNRNKHKQKQPKPGTDAAMEKVITDAFKKAGVEA